MNTHPLPADEHVFAQWLEEARPKMMRSACHYFKHKMDREDLVSQTYFKAITNWESFNGDSELLTWLTTIMRREFINTHRTLNGRGNAELQQFDPETMRSPSVQPTQQIYLEEQQEYEAFEAGMNRLPANQRLALRHQFQGATLQETAEAMGCEMSAVKSRQSRAREALIKICPRLLGRATSAQPIIN